MNKQIISAMLSAVICIAPVAMPCAFSSINASAVSTAMEDETLAGYVQRIYEMVNEERAKEGINPVTFNPKLNYVANIRAEETITANGHTRPNGLPWSTVFEENRISVGSCGENILSMNYMSNIPDIAMSTWMGSSIHHKNIMNEDYTQIGVGAVHSGDIYYFVQIFSTEAVSWDISGNTFIIDGAGRTPNYNPDNRAWNDSIDDITEVSIGDKITEIGRYVFYNMYNLKSVTLPENVKKVDMYAFNSCSSLEEIVFRNPECEIEGSTETIPSGAVICGYENSTAQTFAEQYGYNFKVLENNPETNGLALGDVNGDGFINAIDASAISMEYAQLSIVDGNPTFTDEQKKAGDVNEDGAVNAVDASCVASYYAYLSTGKNETKMNMKEWIESPEFNSPSAEEE